MTPYQAILKHHKPQHTATLAETSIAIYPGYIITTTDQVTLHILPTPNHKKKQIKAIITHPHSNPHHWLNSLQHHPQATQIDLTDPNSIEQLQQTLNLIKFQQKTKPA